MTELDALREAICLYRDKAFIVLEASPQLVTIIEAAEEWLRFMESDKGERP